MEGERRTGIIKTISAGNDVFLTPSAGEGCEDVPVFFEVLDHVVSDVGRGATAGAKSEGDEGEQEVG